MEALIQYIVDKQCVDCSSVLLDIGESCTLSVFVLVELVMQAQVPEIIHHRRL